MAGLIETLELYGYKYNRTCNCDGTRTFVYKRADYELRWRIKKGTFRIKHYGVTQVFSREIDLAEETLKSIHNESVPA